MKDFLILLGWLSLAGSALGLAVTAVGRLSKGRLSRAFCCGLWALVLLRLVAPFGLPEQLRPVSLLARVTHSAQLAEELSAARRDATPGASLSALILADERYTGALRVISGGEDPAVKTETGFAAPDPGAPEAPADVTQTTTQTGAPPQAEPDAARPVFSFADAVRSVRRDPWAVLFGVWVCGALFRLLWQVHSYRAFRRRVLSFACPAPLEARIAFVSRYEGSRLRLVSSPDVHTALLLGLMDPVIVLPQSTPILLERGAVDSVLRHELSHYRRGDLWLKWAAELVCCLHWFNPLVRLMRRELNRACELACDEAVIRTMTAKEKQTYGETLIAFAGRQGRAAVPLTAICEQKKQLKERLVCIMKYKKRNLLSVLACCCLLALLCGCAAALGPDESLSEPLPVESAVSSTTDPQEEGKTATLLTDTVEKATLVAASNDMMDHMYASYGTYVYAGEKMWFYGYEFIDETQTDTVKRLASMNPDGTDLQVVDMTYPDLTLDPLPELSENEVIRPSFQNLADVGGDRPQVVWAIYHMDNTAQTVDPLHSEYRLSEIAEDGSIADGIRLDIDMPAHYYLSILDCVEGSIWFQYYPTPAMEGGQFGEPWHLMGFSTEDGRLLTDITLPKLTSVQSIGAMAGGKLMVQTVTIEPMENGFGFEEGSDKFYILDPAAGELALKDPFILPSPLRGTGVELVNQPMCALSPEAALWSNDGLFLWDTEANTLHKKYDWLAFGGGAYTMDFCALYCNDGRYFCRDQRDSRKAMKLNTVAPAGSLATEDDDRTVITVGTVDSAPLKDAVSAFNAASTTHRVELVLYTDADAQAAGLTNAVDLLYRQIIQGSAPDIIDLPNGMDTGGLLNKGIFVDLYPLLDADPDMARADFVAGMLKACEADGKLSTVVPYYSLLTAIGSEAKFGTEMGWTWQEFEAATASTPTPFYGLSRELALWYQVQMGGTQFIDYGTGKANFDNDTFVRLLESCAAYGDTFPDLLADPKPGFADGTHLLQFLFNVDFNNVPTHVYHFDGPIVYKGLPSADGGSGSMFTFGLRLGITSFCKDPDAAWQFLRTLLLPEYQNNIRDVYFSMLPLRRDSLDRLAKKAQETRTDGYIAPAYLGELTQQQVEYFSRGLTEAETQAILDAIEATDTLFQFDGTVMNILQEEALNYYNGMYTAEEAAGYIQKRIQLYLDEIS